jgi:hypothetical protein
VTRIDHLEAFNEGLAMHTRQPNPVV